MGSGVPRDEDKAYGDFPKFSRPFFRGVRAIRIRQYSGIHIGLPLCMETEAGFWGHEFAGLRLGGFNPAQDFEPRSLGIRV